MFDCVKKFLKENIRELDSNSSFLKNMLLISSPSKP